jgi:3-hydroxybutyryl-CoA dehydrogenase
MNQETQHIGVVGAGAMGQGIAQVATQALAEVWVFDVVPGAADKACAAVRGQWQKLQEKGRLTAAQVQDFSQRLKAAEHLHDLAQCHVVIEAVVENLTVKQALIAQLENLLADSAIIASNTSSLSVTALAADMKHPQRFAGFHFFNPVPLMKVVEVVAGLATSEATCQSLMGWAQAMGHQAVRAKDTPGFIVNHAGRGYITEALRTASEGIADFATIDRILKDQVGFKLGPFELLDLTALDVSHPVMESIYHQ